MPACQTPRESSADRTSTGRSAAKVHAGGQLRPDRYTAGRTREPGGSQQAELPRLTAVERWEPDETWALRKDQGATAVFRVGAALVRRDMMINQVRDAKGDFSF